MIMALQPFSTTVVGSWPRSEAVQAALRNVRAGRISEDQFQQIADDAIRRAVRAQEESGITMVSDGELRRDNFISFVAGSLKNVRMMTVSEMLPYVDDKAGFEEILGTLDVPAFSLSNPVAIGPISRHTSIAKREVNFLKSITNRASRLHCPALIFLPGLCG